LLANSLRNALADVLLEGGLVNRLACDLYENVLENLGRAYQASDMRRQDSVGTAFHGVSLCRLGDIRTGILLGNQHCEDVFCERGEAASVLRRRAPAHRGQISFEKSVRRALISTGRWFVHHVPSPCVSRASQCSTKFPQYGKFLRTRHYGRVEAS